VCFAGSLPRTNLALLGLLLAADPLVRDQTLDLRRLVEGLVTHFELAADDVFGNIILGAEGERLPDLASSLRAESARLLVISQAGNFAGAFLKHLKGNDAEIGAGDAASDGLALALTSSLGAVRLNSRLHEDSDSAVDKDSLLHGKALLVVAAGDSERVTLEFISQNLALDIGAHSPVVELATNHKGQ